VHLRNQEFKDIVGAVVNHGTASPIIASAVNHHTRPGFYIGQCAFTDIVRSTQHIHWISHHGKSCYQPLGVQGKGFQMRSPHPNREPAVALRYGYTFGLGACPVSPPWRTKGPWVENSRGWLVRCSRSVFRPVIGSWAKLVQGGDG